MSSRRLDPRAPRSPRKALTGAAAAAFSALLLAPASAGSQTAAPEPAGVTQEAAAARARQSTQPSAAAVAEARSNAAAFIEVVEGMLDQMIEHATTELRSRGSTRRAAEFESHIAIQRERFDRAKIGVDRLPDAAVVSMSVLLRDSRMSILESLSMTHQGAHFDLGFAEALDEGMTEMVTVPSVDHWFVDSCKGDVQLTCAAPACTVIIFVLEQLDFAMFDDIEITIFGVGIPLPNPFKFITAIAVEIAQAVCDGVQCGGETEDNFCGPSNESMFILTYAGEDRPDGSGKYSPISGSVTSIGPSSEIIKIPFVEKTIAEINWNTDGEVAASRDSLWGLLDLSHDQVRNLLKGSLNVDHTRLDAKIDAVNDLLAAINNGLQIIIDRVGDPEDPDPTVTTVSSQLVKAASFDDVLALESSLQTELDKVGVPAEPGLPDQDTMFEVLEKILAEQTEGLPLEIVLDRSLLEGRLIPTLFLPANAGGLIEEVQALVWSEIERAIEEGTTDITFIEELALRADQELAEWRFAEAFLSYSRAYRRLRVERPGTPVSRPSSRSSEAEPRLVSDQNGGRQ